MTGNDQNNWLPSKVTGIIIKNRHLPPNIANSPFINSRQRSFLTFSITFCSSLFLHAILRTISDLFRLKLFLDNVGSSKLGYNICYFALNHSNDYEKHSLSYERAKVHSVRSVCGSISVASRATY